MRIKNNWSLVTPLVAFLMAHAAINAQNKAFFEKRSVAALNSNSSVVFNDHPFYSAYVIQSPEYQFANSSDEHMIALAAENYQFNSSALNDKFGSSFTNTNSQELPYYSFIKNFTYTESAGNVVKDTFLLRNHNARLMRKYGRGSFFIFGVEILGMGILMMMPKDVTHWKPGFIKDAEKNLKRAFTHMPVIDKDDWQINYIGHPVAGSYYYNSVRSQNATILESFSFAFLQSTFWEYVIEGVAEPPSIQDLIVTPVGGALLGEATHVGTTLMRKNGFNFFEKVLITIINPMYVINNGYRSKNKPPKY